MIAEDRCAQLVTCEHGGNRIPAEFRDLFAPHADLIAGHRGWDPGALELARRLARRLAAPLHVATVSRLVVDLNRSAGNPKVFSTITRRLGRARREEILAAFWRPYRTRVEKEVALLAAAGGPGALHLSIHTFTPNLDGRERRADVGLLYDPGRPPETRFCRRLKAALRSRRPDLVVRFNHPYRGVADGFTTALRRRFPPARYLGIEIEVNQRHPLGLAADWRRLSDDLVEAVAEIAAPAGQSSAGG
jgi:predicted N-formylglutamate amidohydrolase